MDKIRRLEWPPDRSQGPDFQYYNMPFRELEIIGRSAGCCSVRIIEECVAIMSVAMTLLENNLDN